MNESGEGTNRIPQTPEEIIKTYLSYQDANISEDLKHKGLADSLRSENAKNYANALLELSGNAGFTPLLRFAREMRVRVREDANKLHLPLTPYADSNTWALWDMGKQYYLWKQWTARGRPDQSDSPYHLDNPVTSARLQQEIVDRHLGWEAHIAFKDGRWTKRAEDDKKIRESAAMSFLQKETKPDGQLGSSDLAKLGKILHDVARSSDRTDDTVVRKDRIEVATNQNQEPVVAGTNTLPAANNTGSGTDIVKAAGTAITGLGAGATTAAGGTIFAALSLTGLAGWVIAGGFGKIMQYSLKVFTASFQQGTKALGGVFKSSGGGGHGGGHDSHGGGHDDHGHSAKKGDHH